MQTLRRRLPPQRVKLSPEAHCLLSFLPASPPTILLQPLPLQALLLPLPPAPVSQSPFPYPYSPSLHSASVPQTAFHPSAPSALLHLPDSGNALSVLPHPPGQLSDRNSSLTL